MSPPDLFGNAATAWQEDEKSPAAFKTISEVSEMLDVPTHVLRFWESKFIHLKPVKGKGGRRYYRPEDVAMLANIRHLLYERGYTIKGAQQAIAHPVADDVPVAVIAPVPASAAVQEGKTALRKLKAELSEMRAMLKNAASKH